MYNKSKILVVTSLLALAFIACPKQQSAEPVKPSPDNPFAVPKDLMVSAKDAKMGHCARDLNCFSARAAKCLPASGSITHIRTSHGARRIQVWKQEILGEQAGLCLFKRTLSEIRMEIPAHLRQNLIAQGTPAAAIDNLGKNALAKIRAKGEHLLLCKVSSADLVKMLKSMYAGPPPNASTPGCSFPERRCDPLPALADGCAAGPCSEGSWPITCKDAKDAKGNERKCKITGPAPAGATADCDAANKVVLIPAAAGAKDATQAASPGVKHKEISPKEGKTQDVPKGGKSAEPKAGTRH